MRKVIDRSGLVVTVLDYGRLFNTHDGHGSMFKLRSFHSSQFASVYSSEMCSKFVWEVPVMD